MIKLFIFLTWSGLTFVVAEPHDTMASCLERKDELIEIHENKEETEIVDIYCKEEAYD